MKDLFSSFTNPSPDVVKKAWRSKNTVFVFDTNVFLNLYGYAEQTRKDFFNVANGIKDKIWIPYQVGLEYHRRRLNVIKNEKKVFRDIEGILEKIPSGVSSDLQAYAMWKKDPELDAHLQDLIKSIQKEVLACKDKVTEWNKRQPDVRSSDLILDQIHEITKGKIGPQPENQDWLDAIYKEGEFRYEKKIPPGFEDRDKGKGDSEETEFRHCDLNYQRKFGDLIMWKQLLNKAAEPGVTNIIFVTDDSKKDWWNIIDSGGKKIIGPHENLKSEIYKVSEVDFFHMYTTSEFLEESKGFLNSNIQQSSIEDAYEKNIFSLNDTDEAPINTHLNIIPGKHIYYLSDGSPVYLSSESSVEKPYIEQIRKSYYKRRSHDQSRASLDEAIDNLKSNKFSDGEMSFVEKYEKWRRSQKLAEIEDELNKLREGFDESNSSRSRGKPDNDDDINDMNDIDWSE